MKHKFLLDINILYCATKGVDQDRRPDNTCVDLIRLIFLNSHSIRMDTVLLERYKHHLAWLQQDPASMLEPLRALNSIMQNSRKAVLEEGNPPNVPPGIPIPQNDVYAVRAALVSQPTVVTCDGSLKRCINEHSDTLGLRAIDPAEALELAKDT